MFVIIAELLVGLLIHEIIDFALVIEVDLEDPAVTLGLVVDKGGVTLDILVVGGDSASHWCVNISGGLDRLDAADAITLEELGADLSDVQVHDISELTLGEVGDADLGLLYMWVRVTQSYDSLFLPGSRC